MADDSKESSTHVRVVRGQVDSLSLFEITDYELAQLESGTPASIQFNFAIFFISVAVSFLITLLTVDNISVRTFNIFVIFTVVGFALGVVLLALWYPSRRSVSAVVKKIKARVPLAAVSSPEVNAQAEGPPLKVPPTSEKSKKRKH